MSVVGDLMRHDVAIATPDASVRQVIELMVDMDVESVLIADGRRRVIGTVGDEQLVAGVHASWHRPWWRQLVAEDGASWSDKRLPTLEASTVMRRRVVIVVPDTSAMTAIRLFDEYGVNVLPVAGAQGL